MSALVIFSVYRPYEDKVDDNSCKKETGDQVEELGALRHQLLGIADIYKP